MKNETDYGKPVGTWCTTHGQDPVHCFCDRRTTHDIVPVYAVIPEGSRLTTHEPRRKTVTMLVDDEVMVIGLGVVVNDTEMGHGERWAGLLFDGFCGFYLDDRRMGGGPIADAVLWIVEGKRP